MPHYCVGGLATMVFVMLAETRWPCPRFEPSYPGGKAYRSALVWLACLFYGVVWPLYWLIGFPDLLLTRNGRDE